VEGEASSELDMALKPSRARGEIGSRTAARICKRYQRGQTNTFSNWTKGLRVAGKIKEELEIRLLETKMREETEKT